MATKTQEQKLGHAAEVLKEALDDNDRLKNDLARVTGERDYYRNRVRPLEALAILVLGEERLPGHNPDLQSLVATYFRTAVSMTPESAMNPVLEEILKFLSPVEEVAPAETAEASGEELLAQNPNK